MRRGLVTLLIAGFLAACQTTAPKEAHRRSLLDQTSKRSADIMLCDADFAEDLQRVAADHGRTASWWFFIEACDRVLARGESDLVTSAVLAERGVFLDLLGHRGEALADINAAIKLQPDFARGYLARARLHSNHGAHDLAEQDFVAALRLASGSSRPFILNNVAWERVRSGDYEAGLALANEALAEQSDPIVGFDTQAHALMGLGRHKAAEEAFLKAADSRGASLIRRYQLALVRKGYSPGRTDGVLDDATRAALRACIRDNCRLLLD
jgi:tetratricopeptide (TPR) repeat protein